MTNYATRGRVAALAACLFCLMIGLATAIIIGRTQGGEFWLIFGGNTDPGDTQGGGMARDQMIEGGWTDAEHSYQVQWKADLSQGSDTETNQAMPAGHDAYGRLCAAKRCIIAGFSSGTSPAIQLALEVGHPAGQTYLFGAPQPSTGVWHQQYLDNVFVQPWVALIGGIDPNALATPGMQAFYTVSDPYANSAPQCSGPGLFALNMQGHRIITRAEADQHVWTGPDGVVMHEADYAGPLSLPLSGADPSPLWAGCLADDWHATQLSPGQGVTEPGTEGGSPSPSLPVPTEMPTPTDLPGG